MRLFFIFLWIYSYRISDSACAYNFICFSLFKSVNLVVIKSIDDVDDADKLVVVSLVNSSSFSSISSIRPRPIFDIDRDNDGR